MREYNKNYRAKAALTGADGSSNIQVVTVEDADELVGSEEVL